jgi:hypothetical protein
VPRERNAHLSDDGRRWRTQVVGLMDQAVRACNMSWPELIAEAGGVLYGAAFDKSTAYRWRRSEAAIPSEVLVYALAKAKVSLANKQLEQGMPAEVLSRIGNLLQAQAQALSDLTEHVASLDRKIAP